MRVRDIENDGLRERVQEEQRHVLRKKYSERDARPLNELLPPGDGFTLLPADKAVFVGVTIEEQPNVVLPSAVLEHLIRTASHRVIANFCLCRDGMECRDFPVDWGCIFMGDAAKAISPELGRAVTVDEALEYAANCRAAGLVHIVGRFTPDLNWLNDGVGPISQLVTVCNCCPCCCGMRILPFVREPNRDQVVSRMPGMGLQVSDDCIGCGECEERCMFQGIEIKDGKAVPNELCRACGRCVDTCSSQAIRITLERPDAVEITLASLRERVDHT